MLYPDFKLRYAILAAGKTVDGKGDSYHQNIVMQLSWLAAPTTRQQSMLLWTRSTSTARDTGSVSKVASSDSYILQFKDTPLSSSGLAHWLDLRKKGTSW